MRADLGELIRLLEERADDHGGDALLREAAAALRAVMEAPVVEVYSIKLHQTLLDKDGQRVRIVPAGDGDE